MSNLGQSSYGQQTEQDRYRQFRNMEEARQRAAWDNRNGPFHFLPPTLQQFYAYETQNPGPAGTVYVAENTESPIQKIRRLNDSKGLWASVGRQAGRIGLATGVLIGYTIYQEGLPPTSIDLFTDQREDGSGETVPWANAADAEEQITDFLTRHDITLEELIRGGSPQSVEPLDLRTVVKHSSGPTMRVVTVDRININNVGDISWTGRVLAQGTDNGESLDPNWSLEIDVNSQETVTVQTPYTVQFIQHEGRRYSVVIDRFNLGGDNAIVGWPAQDRAGMSVPTIATTDSVFGRNIYPRPRVEDLSENPEARYLDPNSPTNPYPYFTGVSLNEAFVVFGIADYNQNIAPIAVQGMTTLGGPLVEGNGFNVTTRVSWEGIHPGEFTPDNEPVSSVWFNSADANARARDSRLTQIENADPYSRALDERVAGYRANVEREPIEIPRPLYIRGSSVELFGETPNQGPVAPNDLRSTHEILWCRNAGEIAPPPQTDVSDRLYGSCAAPAGGSMGRSLLD